MLPCTVEEVVQHVVQAAGLRQVGLLELADLGVEEGLADLRERPDAREAVAVAQAVVQERQREAGHERVDPEGEAGQLDCNLVDVDAVDASTRDLAT